MRLLPIFVAFAVVYVLTVVLMGGDGMVVGAGLLILLVLGVIAGVPALRMRNADRSRS